MGTLRREAPRPPVVARDPFDVERHVERLVDLLSGSISTPGLAGVVAGGGGVASGGVLGCDMRDPSWGAGQFGYITVTTGTTTTTASPLGTTTAAAGAGEIVTLLLGGGR